MNVYKFKKIKTKKAMPLFSFWIYRYLVLFIDEQQIGGLYILLLSFVIMLTRTH